jgi:hypothetical protein
VIDVAPMWGSDVGGILSMVPAYAVTLVLLAGRRIRIRTVAIIGVAIGVVGAIAAAIDLSRPREDRTHLGRYLTRIQDRGIGEGWSVIQRKLDANLSSVRTGILGLMLLVTAVLLVVLWFGGAIASRGVRAGSRSGAPPASASPCSRCSASRSTTPGSPCRHHARRVPGGLGPAARRRRARDGSTTPPTDDADDRVLVPA